MLLHLGHLHIVKYLIDEQGCNPSCLDDLGYIPLHCSAMLGHMDIVKFLTVENHTGSDQNTPLYMAAGNNYKGIVKFLTPDMHCDPTSRNAACSTSSNIYGHLDIVKFFISDQKMF